MRHGNMFGKEIRARLSDGGERTIQKLAKELAQRGGRERSFALAKRLWAGGRPEERTLAIRLLDELARFLRAVHWNLFRSWIEEDERLGDAVARRLLGALVAEDRSWIRVLRHWTRSADVRIRRAAALAVRERASRMGDLEAAFFVCTPLLEDPDPGVRRGVEEVLRECATIDRDAVRKFLREVGSSSRGRRPRL